MSEGRLETLLDAVMEPEPDPAAVRELRELLRRDPQALDAYVDQIRINAMLAWRFGEVSAAPAVSAPARAKPQITWRRWAVAAGLLLVAGLAAFLVIHVMRPAPKPLATIGRIDGVTWASGQPALADGSRLASGTLAIASGSLAFTTDSGATVTLHGSASVELVDRMQLRLESGQLTIRIDTSATGFAVETPAARIVDLGTEFGVCVDAQGRTDVVVFEGMVSITRKADPAAAPMHLAKGDAVRLGRDGQQQRIASIRRSASDSNWSTAADDNPAAVVESVHDGMRNQASRKFYQIVRGGLIEDSQAYVDRCYEWNGVETDGIPQALRGADLIMTFNDDKRADDLQLSVTLARPAMMYVFFNEQSAPPAWLTRDFEPTAMKIGLDEGPPDMPALQLARGPGQSIDRVYSVWQRRIDRPGTVTLGECDAKTMYGIAATPLPEGN